MLNYTSAEDMSSLSNAGAHSFIMILIQIHTTCQINSSFVLSVTFYINVLHVNC